MKAKSAGDTEFRGSGSIGLKSVASAVRLLQLGFEPCDPQSTRAGLFVLLDAVEALFKLGDQRRLTRLETTTSHDAPEVIPPRSVSVEHGHDIFRWSTCHKDDDVGFGRPVHERQFAPLLNSVLHGADRLPIVGQQILIELISVVGSNV